MSDSAEHVEANQETHDLQDLEREERDDIEDEKDSKNESGEIEAPADDEDDEDEDDEDEDEDEEDRVQSRKRARRDRNQFLDVEAEVSDDEDDEEDDEDELTKEGFIANDHDNEEATRRDDRLHRQVDRSHEKSTEEDAQKLAAQFKERYGRANKYRGEDSGFVSQRFLLPSINDPSIWAIRCRPGKEKEIVKKLLKRKLTLRGKPSEPKFLSAFQRDNFTGYIYIEAEKLTAVDVAIRGFPDIYASNKLLVPVEEFPNLLRASKSSDVKVEPGSYVRVKRGKFKGDLAIVDNVEDNGLEVILQLVPRIDYKGGEIDEDTGKRKRISSKFRPPQRLFSKKDALEYDPSNLIVKSNTSFYYKGEEYIDGFLFKQFKLQFLETQNVHPKLEEISRFNTGDDDKLDLTSIAQSLKSSKATVFNTGDRVQVLQGEQQGLQGDVISAANETVLIKPSGIQSSNLEFPISNLRKIFHEGDHISVIKGNHNGHTGIVVSVKEDHVTFISDQSHKDITVFANHLTKSTDSSTLIDGKYDLHDLVRLNSTTVGVVIKADKDVFTVLSQDGKVLSLSPTSIISKVDIRKDQAFAADSMGNPIKIGDSVTENGGFKRQGNILHIYRSILFLYSKETAENNGIFVTQISSVTNVAAKSLTDDNKDKKLDLTKMNPKFRSGGDMAPPALPVKMQTGRDNTINKHVSIRLGEYKGLRGIIKDTNGDIARVELHTKNKIINISKTKLSFVSDDNRLIPYDDFVRNSSIRGGTIYTNTPSAAQAQSGASSNWASNAVQSKPWSGGTTSYGSDTSYGGGTAWGGAAGGAGTAWGGGTQHGGSGTSWGNSGGSGTAWGGQQTGAGSSWGSQQTHQGSQWGNGTSHGAGSQWGANNGSNTGYGTGYGGGTGYGTSWGNRSAYGGNNNRNNWNTAATPGSFQQAETPGANYNSAQTPYDDYGYDTAQTPGVAQTPGADYRE